MHWQFTVKGYFAHKKLLTPQDHRRILGVGLLQGLGEWQFLMGEVPLHMAYSK